MIIAGITIFFLLFAGAAFMFGWNQSKRGLEGKLVRTKLPELANQEGSDRSKKITEHQKDQLMLKVQHLMDVDKIYRLPELNIESVAKFLNTNKSYISIVVNERTGANFRNYVNKYRVEDVALKLQDPYNHNLTFEALAKDVGFKSKSAFNSSFKKFAGYTPSQYMQAIKDELAQQAMLTISEVA